MSLLRHAVLSISGCFIVLGISTSTSGLATRPALQTVRVRIFADRSLGRMVVRSAYGTGVQIENSLVDGPVILRPSGRGIAVLAQPHAGAAAHGSHPAKRAIAPAGREFT